MAEDQGKDNSFPSNDNLRSDSNLSSEWEVIPEPPTPLEEHKHLIPPVAVSFILSYFMYVFILSYYTCVCSRAVGRVDPNM